MIASMLSFSTSLWSTSTRRWRSQTSDTRTSWEHARNRKTWKKTSTNQSLTFALHWKTDRRWCPFLTTLSCACMFDSCTCTTSTCAFSRRSFKKVGLRETWRKKLKSHFGSSCRLTRWRVSTTNKLELFTYMYKKRTTCTYIHFRFFATGDYRRLLHTHFSANKTKTRRGKIENHNL